MLRSARRVPPASPTDQPPAPTTPIAWRRLAALIAPYWRALLLALVLLTATSLIGLALPLAIRWLVDSVFVERDANQLNSVALGLLGLFVAQSLLSVGHAYLIGRAGQQLVADLRLRIYTHLQHLPLRFFNTRRTGEIVSRVSSDATVVQEVLTETPIAFLRQLITLVGGVALMLLMNWRLTLLVLALVPPVVITGALFGRRLQRISTAVQDRLADATVTLEEMLSGIRVVKSFVREDYERTRFEREVQSAYQTAMRRIRVRVLFGPTISLFAFGALTLLLWYGGRQVVEGTLTPGELIAFLFYMMMVAGPMGDFANLYGRVREGMGAGQRLFDILDAPPEPAAPLLPGPAAAPTLHGAVAFEAVRFWYTDQQATPDTVAPPGSNGQAAPPVILDGIDFAVAPGETVALVGPSGAGKTTLVNLIPRFYEPAAGRILFDGRDARSFGLGDLRAQIGIVPQETFLFGGSIRENIGYGRPGADDAAIKAAARAANAHAFIDALPDGYATLVGERGVRLSVGQRQRIAIARVLLKDPRILILDEATSALDSESERLVQEALERLLEGRTAFVIAHRLSTIQRANRILVLQGGQIVESGRHDELLAAGGLYQRLWSIQFQNAPVLEASHEDR
ncbi:MAG: ABC transporter ATP-binding protein [Roseiflexaceae bacterium]